MERTILSKEEEMIEINCSKLSKIKDSFEEIHDDFTLVFLKNQVKIKHARGNSTCHFYKGSIRVAKKYNNCYVNLFVNGNQTIHLHLDKLKQILDTDFERKERQKIEKNVSNITDLMLLGYIENHLSGLEYEKTIWLLGYEFHFKWGTYNYIRFSWNKLKEKNNESVDDLTCYFNFTDYNKSGEVPFYKVIEIVPELIKLQDFEKQIFQLRQTSVEHKLNVTKIFNK